MEEVSGKCFERKFEYIRIRLYLMASLPCFYILAAERVHLYSETCFIKKICETLGVNKRKFSQYYKIAKTKLMAIEDKTNQELYNALAKEYSEEYEIEFKIFPENKSLLNDLLKDFKE